MKQLEHLNKYPPIDYVSLTPTIWISIYASKVLAKRFAFNVELSSSELDQHYRFELSLSM